MWQATIEKFLHEIGVEPAESTSRNPLEQVWALGVEEVLRRTKNLTGLGDLLGLRRDARKETMSTTEKIVKVESEIDERVKALYGL
jgi:hypothetical protein